MTSSFWLETSPVLSDFQPSNRWRITGLWTSSFGSDLARPMLRTCQGDRNSSVWVLIVSTWWWTMRTTGQRRSGWENSAVRVLDEFLCFFCQICLWTVWHFWSLGPWVPQRLDPLDPIAGPDCPLWALLPRATATRTPWLTFASFLGRKQGANTCNGAMGTDTMWCDVMWCDVMWVDCVHEIV